MATAKRRPEEGRNGSYVLWRGWPSRRPCGAAEPASLIDFEVTWPTSSEGQLPGKVPFISDSGSPPFDGGASCSLETGAAIWERPTSCSMNSNHNMTTLTPSISTGWRRARSDLCVATRKYQETAQAVSAISKKYPTIVAD